MPRHRHQEFLRFLKKVKRQSDPEFELHFILDNYATHKHPKVKQLLQKKPRASISVLDGVRGVRACDRYRLGQDDRSGSGSKYSSR